jgi:hypothetical protein
MFRLPGHLASDDMSAAPLAEIWRLAIASAERVKMQPSVVSRRH